MRRVIDERIFAAWTVLQRLSIRLSGRVRDFYRVDPRHLVVPAIFWICALSDGVVVVVFLCLSSAVVSCLSLVLALFLLSVSDLRSTTLLLLLFRRPLCPKSLSSCPDSLLLVTRVDFRAKRPPTSALPCLALGLAVGCTSGPSGGQRLLDGELLLERLSPECFA